MENTGTLQPGDSSIPQPSEAVLLTRVWPNTTSSTRPRAQEPYPRYLNWYVRITIRESTEQFFNATLSGYTQNIPPRRNTPLSVLGFFPPVHKEPPRRFSSWNISFMSVLSKLLVSDDPLGVESVCMGHQKACAI